MHGHGQMKKPDLYRNLIYDGIDSAEALIATGNGSHLRGFSKQELEEIDLRYQKKKQSLFEMALLYGDLEAIKSLVDAKVSISANEKSIKNYLKKLFVQYGALYAYDNERNSNDKSAGNLVQIYRYLQNTVFKNNHDWSNSATINNMLADVANGQEISPLQALVDLGLVTDVNIVDKTGKTALYYLMTKPDNYESLVDFLKTHGAKLSQADELALKQQAFASDFQKAVEEKNPKLLKEYLDIILKDNQILTQELFMKCLGVAINKEDIETVKLMLQSHYSDAMNFQKLGDDERPQSVEMAYAIAVSSQKKVDLDSEYFDVNLKKYAHRIGMEGEITGVSEAQEMKYELEAFHNIQSGAMLLDSLCNYAASNPAFQHFYRAAAFGNVISSITNEDDLYASACYQYYVEGNSMLLASGWTSHAVGLGIKYDSNTNKTYLSISNRGGGGLEVCVIENAKKSLESVPKYGTVVYEMDGQLDKEFFNKMNPLFTDCRLATEDDFSKAINQQLKDAKLIAALPAKPQGQGTCSYVNPKRAIEGLLLIDAVCKGEKINQETLDDIYNQYKLFSVHDKKEAIKGLINYYQAVTTNPDANPLEVDAITKFVEAIILAHHSNKYDHVELESAQKLFMILPEIMKKKLSAAVPELVASKETSKMRMFSQQRNRQREIVIKGNVSYILLYDDSVKKLIEFLKNNNIAEKVRSISVGQNEVTLQISGGRKEKYEVLEVLKDKCDIENVQGKAMFIIKNIDALHFPPHVHPQNK